MKIAKTVSRLALTLVDALGQPTGSTLSDKRLSRFQKKYASNNTRRRQASMINCSLEYMDSHGSMETQHDSDAPRLDCRLCVIFVANRASKNTKVTLCVGLGIALWS